MSEIVVIGGGIVGVSIASRLSKFTTVTLLEGEKNLGYHASRPSPAVFIQDYGNKIIRTLNLTSSKFLEQANGGVLGLRGL